MSKYDNLENTKFYRWNIIEKIKKGYHTAYRCVCDCGTEKVVYAHMLVEGNPRKSSSCGCYKSEVAKKRFKSHGNCSNGFESITYKSWQNMIQRCTNKKHSSYSVYGGAGKTVCDEWLVFENFFSDMGERPSKKHSIERNDLKLGYFKQNCEWSEQGKQNFNRNLQKSNTSGVCGVYFDKKRKKYISRITFEGKQINLGGYLTLEEAKTVREKAEIKYYGFNPNR